MRLVWQYRIPMPLSVEEQRVGLRFMIMEGMYRWAQDQIQFSKYYKEGQVYSKFTLQGNWRRCRNPVVGELALLYRRLSPSPALSMLSALYLPWALLSKSLLP